MHSAGVVPTRAITKPPYQARRDEELVAAACAGSEAAFEQLQKLYSTRLYRRILSITRNHADAEDALQDTFVRAFLGLRSFQGRSHLLTWLTTIATNSALMVIRRRRGAQAEVSLTQAAESEEGFQEIDVRDWSPTPEESCDWKQASDMVFRAIGRLDPPLRSAIRIQITQECSMKEIAHALDLSVAAVKARLYRARKALAESLAPRDLKRNSQKPCGFERIIQNRAAACLTSD